MSEEDQLAYAGEFGEKVSSFLEGEIGQYLLNCKDLDEKEAQDKFNDLDPFAYESLGSLQNAIAKLQEDVLIARKISAYLGDAIIRGNEADQLLMSKEET